jgi:serine/threonine-protein kinase
LNVTDSGNGLFWTRADGASQPQLLLPGRDYRLPWSTSASAKRLAYYDESGGGTRGFPIYTVPIEEQNGQLKAGAPVQFLKDQVLGGEPAFSPDGKWLAYGSAESGTRSEVFVRPFQQPSSGPGGRWVISTQGGESPVWSPTSPDLLYRAPGGQIMAVRYKVQGDAFQADPPRMWTAKPVGTVFDLAPDGKRLAVVTPVNSPAEDKPEHDVVFLQNFFDELRRRAPVGK